MVNVKIFAIGVCLSLWAISSGLSAKSLSHYELETVAEGISIPWGMALVDKDQLLVSDKVGKLLLVDLAKKQFEEVAGMPKVTSRGQGGLLDIKLHPNYADNGWIYISYSSPEGEGDGDNTAIIRARLKGSRLVDVETLYKASPNSSRKHHFGSRIAFDKKGYLYFSIGDRGERDRLPQDLSLDGGKIYRLFDDGKIPKDNPFADQKGTKAAIYSFGHRNPQGMAMHPESGQIWTHEHGPKGGDEINIISAGKNYGWPIVSYGVNYSGTKFTDLTEKEGMESPNWYWVPSIAPSGMTFITSDFYPELKGSLLVGSLKFGRVHRLEIDGQQVTSDTIWLDNLSRVRNIQQLSDGLIYIAIDGGKIMRVKPVSGSAKD